MLGCSAFDGFCKFFLSSVSWKREQKNGSKRDFPTEDDEFDQTVYGMLGDAPVTCAWEAKLCADRGKGDDVALCLLQRRYRGARIGGVFFHVLASQQRMWL